MFKIAGTGQGCFFSLLAVALFGCGTPDEELDVAQLNQRQELIAETDRLAESSALRWASGGDGLRSASWLRW